MSADRLTASPPAPAVRRGRQPPAPDAPGVDEGAQELVRRRPPGRPVGGRLEHDAGDVAGPESHLGPDVVAVPLERDPRVEGQLDSRSGERGTVLAELDLVALAAVVEPGLALEHEPHLAAHRTDDADQPVV